MKNFRFKFIDPPIKPEKQTFKEERSIESFDNLSQIIEWVQGFNVPFSEVNVNINSYYESSFYSLNFNRSETDEEFAKRLEKYEKELIKYNQWKEDFKEEIASYHRSREERERILKQKEYNRLEKQIKSLQKKADKLRE